MRTRTSTSGGRRPWRHAPAPAALLLLFGAAPLLALGAQDPEPQEPAKTPAQEGGQELPVKRVARRPGRSPADDAAKRLERRRIEREREVLAHFEICDLDGSGWVSYREAEVTLGIEKSEFRLYDADNDGRISRDEFGDRYQTILGLLGAVRPPVRPPAEPDSEEAVVDETEALTEADRSEPAADVPEVFPSPKDLLEIYDRDRNGGLTEAELEAMFRDIGGALSADVVARQMDPDGSGELELSELGPLSMLVSRRLPEPIKEGGPESPSGLAEIYGITLPRKLPPGAPVGPPRILGPVTQFRRLDLWNDGYIDAEDLRQLLTPARINVRPLAVIAALDRNGDERLDPDEFRGCLGVR